MRIRKLLSKILDEDYLSLEDKFVEVGYLTHLFLDSKTNSGQDKKLRQYMEDIIEECESYLVHWFISHGLLSKIESIGADVEDALDNWMDYSSELVNEVLEKIDGLHPDSIDYEEVVNMIRKAMGGESYFADPACEQKDLEKFVNENLFEDEYEDDDGELAHTERVSVTQDDVMHFILDCKDSQVQASDSFMELVDDVEFTYNKAKDIPFLSLEEAVQVFDHFKNLAHTGGNIIEDQAGISFRDINSQIEDKFLAKA